MTKYIRFIQISILIICFFVVDIFGQTQCFTPGKGTSLTFYANAKTTSIRSSPIEQLNCNGGNGCKYSNNVEIVQCSCNGIDGYGNAQWKCESSLPNTLELGTTLVSCEGCASSTDTAKLTGSCGLYYTLNYNINGDFTDDVTIDNNDKHGILIFFEVLFVILIIVAVVLTCITFYKYAIRKYNRYERLPLHQDSFRHVEAVPISHPIPSAQPHPSVNVTTANPQPVVYQSYQNLQPYTTQSYTQSRQNNGFLNGVIVGEALGNKHGRNHLAQDMILMNAMNGSSGENSFATGLLVGESISSGHHGNKHSAGKPSVHNNHSAQHGGKHTSVGFGGSVTR